MKSNGKKLWFLYLVFYFVLVLISLTGFIHQHESESHLNCAICNWLSHFSFILPSLISLFLFLLLFGLLFFGSRNFSFPFASQKYSPRSPPLKSFFQFSFFHTAFLISNFTRSENEKNPFCNLIIIGEKCKRPKG